MALPPRPRPRSRRGLGLGVSLLMGFTVLVVTGDAGSVAAVSSVPTPPIAVTATRGNGTALVTWESPASDGGSAITGYSVSARSGGTAVSVQAGASTRSATVSALDLGVTYAVTVTARNINGSSLESATVTVTPSKTAAKVPSAPLLSPPISGSRSLTIPYALGADNGSTITSTEYTIDNGVSWTTTNASPLEITGLTNGRSYTVKVRSRNRIGVSSAASKSGKPTPSRNIISFVQPQDMALENPDQTLDITASGGQTIVKTTTPKVCSVTGLTVRALVTGTCKLTATNAGDANFAAAASVTRTLTVTVLPPGKVLLWSEEFKGAAGSAPSSSSWTADTGDGCAIGNCGWGNNERQHYLAAANRLDGAADGNLVITATRSGAGANRCYYGACEWTSGKVQTSGKVSFSYGQIEARIKVPSGGGTWPAFWMLGTNIGSVGWPRCGELDIMEALGNAPQTLWGTAHMADNNGGRILRGSSTQLPYQLSEGYHVFAANWTPTSITWLFDYKPYFTVTKADFGFSTWPFGPAANGTVPRMYAILNIAMGGDMGGTIASSLNNATMSVDWVRYYQINGLGTVYKY